MRFSQCSSRENGDGMMPMALNFTHTSFCLIMCHVVLGKLYPNSHFVEAGAASALFGKSFEGVGAVFQ